MNTKSDPVYTYIWLAAVILAYFLVLSVGTARIMPIAAGDAAMVGTLAMSGGYSKVEGGYRTMAILYNYTNPFTRQVSIICCGLITIFYCMNKLRSNLMLLCVSFLLVPPILFGLTQFIKDLVLMPFILACALVLNSKIKRPLKIIIVAAIYIAYSQLGRSYYLLIIFVFVGGVLLSILPVRARVVVLMFAAAVPFLIPQSIFIQIQGARDAVNQFRIGRDIAGAKTAFLNPLTPDSYFSFLVNYIYAAVRLNLPFLFDIRLQEAFLFISVALYGALIWVGNFYDRFSGAIRSLSKDEGRAWNVKASSGLFLSHIIILICFEPDLGSYLRHASSALPYLVPVMVIIDQYFSAGKNRNYKRVGSARS